jgi:hypothetical protein
MNAVSIIVSRRIFTWPRDCDCFPRQFRHTSDSSIRWKLLSLSDQRAILYYEVEHPICIVASRTCRICLISRVDIFRIKSAFSFGLVIKSWSGSKLSIDLWGHLGDVTSETWKRTCALSQQLNSLR